MAFHGNKHIKILILIIILLPLAFISSFIFKNENDKSLKEVLDRLDTRVEKGFGDYTAIITETPVNKDGTLNKQLSAVSVYAQSGQGSLWCRYLVGDKFLPNGKQRAAPTMSIPENWPRPEIDDVLQQAINMLPGNYLVRDGEQVWPFAKGPKLDNLAASIWFGRDKLLINPRQAKAKLLKDVNRPDLTGLYAEGLIYSGNSPLSNKTEETYWIDPNRDDMPVERLSRKYSTDGKTVESKFLTEYIDYTQLHDGRWYPSHWQTTSEYAVRPDKYCREFHLQIFQDMKLDKSWFTNPEERVQSSIEK